MLRSRGLSQSSKLTQITCIFHFHAFVSCLFSLLENNVNQVFFIIWCHICSMQLHLVEFTAWPSINVCVYLIKATYHCLSEDFSWENNSVTSWLLENWTVWLHLCSHMCSCLSALCHLFCREKSLPYTSVIAMWHLVPYFTIPEIGFCVGVGIVTTRSCGDQVPQGHIGVMCRSPLPTPRSAQCRFYKCSGSLSVFLGVTTSSKRG